MGVNNKDETGEKTVYFKKARLQYRSHITPVMRPGPCC